MTRWTDQLGRSSRCARTSIHFLRSTIGCEFILSVEVILACLQVDMAFKRIAVILNRDTCVSLNKRCQSISSVKRDAVLGSAVCFFDGSLEASASFPWQSTSILTLLSYQIDWLHLPAMSKWNQTTVILEGPLRCSFEQRSECDGKSRASRADDPSKLFSKWNVTKN